MTHTTAEFYPACALGDYMLMAKAGLKMMNLMISVMDSDNAEELDDDAQSLCKPMLQVAVAGISMV
jgi:hypothetical protein